MDSQDSQPATTATTTANAPALTTTANAPALTPTERSRLEQAERRLRYASACVGRDTSNVPCRFGALCKKAPAGTCAYLHAPNPGPAKRGLCRRLACWILGLFMVLAEVVAVWSVGFGVFNAAGQLQDQQDGGAKIAGVVSVALLVTLALAAMISFSVKWAW